MIDGDRYKSLCTLGQARWFLGMVGLDVDDLVASGDLPCYLHGGAELVPYEALSAVMQSRADELAAAAAGDDEPSSGVTVPLTADTQNLVEGVSRAARAFERLKGPRPLKSSIGRQVAQSVDTLRPLNEVPEVATYLRCGRTHVFALIKSGALASVKVGRKRLIPASAVHAYLASLDDSLSSERAE